MISVTEASKADVTSHSGEQINWWRVLAHVVAFCAAAAIGGFLVYPSYPQFQAETETAGEAFSAFLTCCVIAGGFGPMALLCLSGAYRLVMRMQRKTRRVPNAARNK
jgi:glycerol uptake facilitator-like aquaporin